MNKNIISKLFPQAVEDFDNKLCPICKDKINLDDFRDVLSVEEYRISGLCQDCQDKTFY